MQTVYVHAVCLCAVVDCPSGAEIETNLQVSDVIGPGEVGLFDCRVINGFDLRWTVTNGPSVLTFNFLGVNPAGTLTTVRGNSIASLVQRLSGVNSTIDRISVLRYVPPSGFTGQVTITCAGTFGSPCSANVSVVGK